METLLSQAEQMPGLLAACRSGPAVRGWDPQTLERALRWGGFFQQLHGRLHARPGLRAALERRLGMLDLGRLRRCPELLTLALLENRALPAAARQRFLRGLLLPPGGEAFAPLLARRKAASLLLLPAASPAEALVRARAQLLLGRLREGPSPPSPALLDQLPVGPALYQAVAAALLEPGAGAEAQASLLPWLLQGGDPERLAALCRLQPASWAASLCSRHPEVRGPYLSLLAAWGSRLAYDPLLGEWKAASGLEEAGVDPVLPWQELRERVICLYQEPEPLPSAVLTHLSHLKAQDGDFQARGVSLWTDLLLDLEASAPQRKPWRDPPSFGCAKGMKRKL
ncbi:Fanconi anemia group F protein [Tiliqua scincoides]|uniref:Fanconi anemia group F protein n=1 Tax=Tiliqua scincoides TaxID=71010 RepID=UPI003462FEA7